MNFTAILGLLMTLWVLIMGIVLGSPLVIFFDVPSVLLVVLGTAGLILAAHGPAGLFTYTCGGMRRLLWPKSGAMWGVEECRMAVRVARSGGQSAILMAACGACIGLCQMFLNIEDPATIGPAMAVCLLTSFYAIMLNILVFLPISRYFNEMVMNAEASADVV